MLLSLWDLDIKVASCDRGLEELYLRMRENLEGCSSSKKPRQDEGGKEAYLTFGSEAEEDEERAGCGSSRGKQLMVDRGVVSNLTPLRSLGCIDPGWEHGVAQDERKKKVKCNYCGKVVSGGINRFKQHLARIQGEVAPCKDTPEDVYLKMKENMKWHRSGRRHKWCEPKEISDSYMRSNIEDEVNEQEKDALHRMNSERKMTGDKRQGKQLRVAFNEMSPCRDLELLLNSTRFDSASLKTPCSQTTPSSKQEKIIRGSGKKSKKEIISAICKFFYYAGVPLEAANSQYFHNMLELVGQHGQGLVGPPSQLIFGDLLQEEIETIRNNLAEHRASWAVTGCSVMADCWRDSESRTLVNLFVSSPHGLYFVSSVDATDIVEDASNLFKLLDKVVEEMGEENVVQVITQNTPSYKAAGKMLEEKRKNLFWTPCATYCIDKMLEGFLNLKCVWKCMEMAQKITKFIYSHIHLLNLVRKEFTQGQELLMPSVSRFASSFTTLQNLLDHRIDLRRMFQSEIWTSSWFSKSDKGKEVENIVLNAKFWKKVLYVVRSVNPIMQVLQKVDTGQSLSMPYIYNDMYKAKLAIQSFHGDDVRKYGPFWNVIDNHWDSLGHHPLYVAAYFLNPSYRYRPHFVAYPEVVRGLNECIVRLEPDKLRRIYAMSQISDYTTAKADFGTELAISTRTQLEPAAWWQQHGISSLQLQQIAVRISSQTCSSIGCEHKWSIYDQVHGQRHSRAAQKRINDLIYVHYNLRLRECHIKRRSDDSISLESALREHLLDDWIIEAEKQASPEDEEIFCDESGAAYDDDEDKNDLIEDEDGNAEARNGSMEILNSSEMLPSDVNPVKAGLATDGAADVNFFEDEESE